MLPMKTRTIEILEPRSFRGGQWGGKEENRIRRFKGEDHMLAFVLLEPEIMATNKISGLISEMSRIEICCDTLES